MLEHIDTCVATRINKTQKVYEICLGLVFAYPMFWVCLVLAYPIIPVALSEDAVECPRIDV